MINPFIMHLLIALVWLFLSGNVSFGNFIVSLGVTFALLALFQKALGCESYVRRVKALVRFLILFVHSVILSNLHIMRIALRQDAAKVQGYFLSYDVTGLTDFEVLLISQCIGLSPGTMAAERSKDGHILILHIFGSDDPQAVREKIDETLKIRILAFTR